MQASLALPGTIEECFFIPWSKKGHKRLYSQALDCPVYSIKKSFQTWWIHIKSDLLIGERKKLKWTLEGERTEQEWLCVLSPPFRAFLGNITLKWCRDIRYISKLKMCHFSKHVEEVFHDRSLHNAAIIGPILISHKQLHKALILGLPYKRMTKCC